MKEFIIFKLRESLNEVIKASNYTVFHGSGTKISNFTNKFVGGKDAFDQEGPGIYFTTSKDDAAMYGKFIYRVDIAPRKLLTNKPVKVNHNTLYKLVKMAPNWKETAQNWDENPEKGVRIAISSAIEYNDNEKDTFLQIWIDFYRDNPVDYVKNMVTLGYDGIIIDGKTDQQGEAISHIIIYNPSIIKVTSTEVLN